MRSPESCGRAVRAEGVVQRVDTVNRELVLFVGDTLLIIDVPADCPITLRGERVKLRMVQPRDRVQATYTERCGLRVAVAVEAQPGGPTPAPARPPADWPRMDQSPVDL